MAASAVLAVLLASALAGAAAGGDIVHQDDQAPKIPGCSNDFVLVCPSPPLLSSPPRSRPLLGFMPSLPNSDFRGNYLVPLLINILRSYPHRVSEPNELPSGGELKLNQIGLPIDEWMDA
jgi:hypothetical protein